MTSATYNTAVTNSFGLINIVVIIACDRSILKILFDLASE